jgi:ribosome biogenesis GTPase
LAVEAVSALQRLGRDALLQHVGHGTAALVGISGTGKTSIANWLLGRDDLATGPVRGHDDQGKHTTSHRELFSLPEGGVLIDTPGMRELGLWMTAADLLASFPELAALAQDCRFQDCQHQSEPECAIRSALASGALPLDRFEHYQKLKQELADRPNATAAGAKQQYRGPSSGGHRSKRRR